MATVQQINAGLKADPQFQALLKTYNDAMRQNSVLGHTPTDNSGNAQALRSYAESFAKSHGFDPGGGGLRQGDSTSLDTTTGQYTTVHDVSGFKSGLVPALAPLIAGTAGIAGAAALGGAGASEGAGAGAGLGAGPAITPFEGLPGALDAVPASTAGGAVAGGAAAGSSAIPGGAAAAGASEAPQLWKGDSAPGGTSMGDILKTLAKLAPAGIAGAALAGGLGGGSGDDPNSPLNSPEMKDMLALADAQAKRKDPLHAALTQIGLNILPRTSR